ncbi:MAG TPA: hypothetical protein EYQ53_06415 [Candidatus Poseidoniales archaeon]|jgi:hypothetical protein|nr:MAG: hypothetical protein CXT69_02900 [Euryarchaeota archaeon]HIG03995.1 hypothetical protein [Candidatus Poseidoniales archaeon]HIK79035.1 hypothetical protein [Candidatus Poseidoniales archaeon]
MSDPLDAFIGASICPNCAVLAPEGSPRCPECGTFHSSVHLEDRIPTAEDLKPHEPKVIDPTLYSLNPNTGIVVEGTSDVEDITKKWQGGNTDFTIEEEEGRPITTTSPPKSSILDAPQFEVVMDDDDGE